MEERAGEGDFQGGDVNIYNREDVGWDDHGVFATTEMVRKRRTGV